jgi:hypothetical protein
MPALKIPRREAFAQALARGVPWRAAYVEAGYKGSISNAAMLRRNCFIVDRLRELQSPAGSPIAADAGTTTGKNSVIEAETATVEGLLRELELVRARAMAEGQTRTAISATMGKAKLQGFGETRRPQGAKDNTFQIFDLSHLTDAQLATLEAIFGPLAAIGADNGRDSDGEDTKS